MTPEEEFRAKLAAARERHGIQPKSKEPDPAKYADAIPTKEDLYDGHAPFNDDLKRYVNGLDPITALERLTHKRPIPTAWANGWHAKNIFRCPWPEHPDNHPGAQFNGPNNGWVCHACNAGGPDWISLFAAAHGYTKIGQKRIDTEGFKRLLVHLRGVFPEWQEEPPATPNDPPSVPVGAPTAPDPDPRTTPIEERTSGTYDWEAVLALSPVHQRGETTFLAEYCRVTAQDTTPEEFNLFNAILGVGMVAGNHVTAPDALPLSGNFGICLVAESGAGKTRSMQHILAMLRRVVPPVVPGSGVRIYGTVFSGQMLVEALRHEDKVTGVAGVSAIPVPIRAVFEYPELSEVAAGNGIQGSILKSKMHEVLDHKPHIEYSSRTAGSISAHHPFASIVTTTQTKRIRDLLKKDDTASGFMNRFLFLMGTAKKQLARGRVNLDFGPADRLLEEIADYASVPRSLGWSNDADEYWERVYHDRIAPMQAEDHHDILTRLDLNLKRMILVFAVNERADQIERHHVEMAEALVGYLVRCYERIIGALLSTEDQEITSWLLEKIADLEQKARAKGATSENAGPTQADLRRYYSKKGWPDWKVQRALRGLEDGRFVMGVEAQGKRGQKTKRYYALESD